jgi:hypothetical protein
VGTCLAGTGKSTFKVISPKTTGFNVSGNAKAMAQLLTAHDTPVMLVSQNADSLKVFAATPNQNNQVIKLEPTDGYADLYFKNGKKRREEFNYGTGYLSQSSRALISQDLLKVTITDFTGKQRQMNFNPKELALQTR